MTELAPVSSTTTETLISLALNAATMKHMALAQNIANVNNDGYRPVQVDFDSQVALFRDQLLTRGNDSSTARALETLRSAVTISESNDPTAKVQLDVEVAKMTQNAVHYQALLAARGKMSSMLRTAINGGR